MRIPTTRRIASETSWRVRDWRRKDCKSVEAVLGCELGHRERESGNEAKYKGEK